MDLNKIYNKDCIEGLKELPDSCIDCCITSPPYFGLRDYGTAKWEGGNSDCNHDGAKKKTRFDYALSEKQQSSPGTDVPQFKNLCNDCGAIRIDNQIGLEETPELYVAKMVEVFTEVKRVLKKEGTLWLNLGDSYSGNNYANGEGESRPKSKLNGGLGVKDYEKVFSQRRLTGKFEGLKPKDLIGIPWLVAFALRSSGWYLRQDIIWHKPNPMPESVTDRCTKAHEYIFLMSKSVKYYYDNEAIKTEYIRLWDESNGGNLSNKGEHKLNGFLKKSPNRKNPLPDECGANKRSVWTVTTKPYSDAHFATFPEDLIVDMIKAGCPEYGIVLDPFMGAGTTALVAAKLNRNFIGFELNESYLQIAKKRLQQHLGFFNPQQF